MFKSKVSLHKTMHFRIKQEKAVNVTANLAFFSVNSIYVNSIHNPFVDQKNQRMMLITIHVHVYGAYFYNWNAKKSYLENLRSYLNKWSTLCAIWWKKSSIAGIFLVNSPKYTSNLYILHKCTSCIYVQLNFKPNSSYLENWMGCLYNRGTL